MTRTPDHRPDHDPGGSEADRAARAEAEDLAAMPEPLVVDEDEPVPPDHPAGDDDAYSVGETLTGHGLPAGDRPPER